MTKKNPADATKRNVVASNKRDAKLAAEIKKLKRQVKELQEVVNEYHGTNLK